MPAVVPETDAVGGEIQTGMADSRGRMGGRFGGAQGTGSGEAGLACRGGLRGTGIGLAGLTRQEGGRYDCDDVGDEQRGSKERVETPRRKNNLFDPPTVEMVRRSPVRFNVTVTREPSASTV